MSQLTNPAPLIDSKIADHAATLHGTTVGEQAIIEASATHAALINNPHAVTAAQVGTYTQAQIDALIASIESQTIDGGTP